MNLEEVLKKTREKYPDKIIDMKYSQISGKYEVVETTVDNKIRFKNISKGGKLGEHSDETFLSILCDTIEKHISIFEKLDRELIIKDRKTICFLDDSEITSEKTLDKKELADKIDFYGIKKEELDPPKMEKK